MRTKVIPAQEEKIMVEMISDISISFLHKTLRVGVVLGESEDSPDHSTLKYYNLDFKKAIEDKPEWSKNKPKNCFREEDLFILIDEVRNVGKAS